VTREHYNSAFLFTGGPLPPQSYAKMHLVPFGERTPFRDSIPLLRDIDWSALTGDLGSAEFTPGVERTLFQHPKGLFSVLICFESAFPDLVRRSALDGARFLVIITNDSWFGRTSGPFQHAQLSILRAVETRTAIARCATSGISLFIDRYGRTTMTTGLYEQAVRVANIRLSEGDTFYTRHGDLFAWVSLLTTVVSLTVLSVAGRRHGCENNGER
jgi:apolipoprotein N-acyltransferase